MDDLLAHEHSRTTDPDTSKTAAQSLGDHNKTVMRALLAALAGGQHMTREEAATAAGIGQYEASKRWSDLRRLGLISDTGVRRNASTGRPQAVHEITTAGLGEHHSPTT